MDLAFADAAAERIAAAEAPWPRTELDERRRDWGFMRRLRWAIRKI
jgi:hypothetical protein